MITGFSHSNLDVDSDLIHILDTPSHIELVVGSVGTNNSFP
jgi:hypothetical protein